MNSYSLRLVDMHGNSAFLSDQHASNAFEAAENALKYNNVPLNSDSYVMVQNQEGYVFKIEVGYAI